jgi:hypothetical protein
MAKLFINGLISNMPVRQGRYEVTSIEVEGQLAFVKATDTRNSAVKVSLTLARRETCVEVGYCRASKDLSVYDHGVFEMPKLDSVTQQVRKALQGL